MKQGDGAADVKPIAHLFKTQVYALAAHLGVPAEVDEPSADDGHVLAPADAGGVLLRRALSTVWTCASTPTSVAFPRAKWPASIDLAPEQVERIYRDIEAKRRATRYLHERPLLVEETGS